MKVLVAYKKSIFDYYSSSPDQSVRDFLKSDDLNVQRIKDSHRTHYECLDEIIKNLEEKGIEYDAFHRADRPDLTSYDLVVPVGGDGTFLDIGHYVRGIPVLGANSDPGRSFGMYCTATKDNFESILDNLNAYTRTELGRLEIAVNGSLIPELVLNEAMLYHANRGNLRFEIDDGEEKRRVTSCYDLFVSTAAGSTGSVYNFGSPALPVNLTKFTYYITGNREEIGKFRMADKLHFNSLTREGIMLLDGEHVKYNFSLGDKVEFRYGVPLTMIGSLEENRKAHGIV